ncbi:MULTISPECIES: hypothetical protein [Bacillus]|uniref:Uncharacterized protein n=1 Tax=Bacillus glycinifermentans TaxID=1664069 RepID=A0AAJ3YW21_9BACI|nr:MULTISPECIES: hypothetical protein [Bacillus]KKB75511.1 hypothetical protein TH62_01465 [Bacillus sp. TH008]MDU0071205.1 hypothetical protein [Bacillus sp. IG6]MED8019073.1 hypothetical protein [Bacillus glycinifermentans]QAT63738.1 hypothetical protein EQZ20_01435 [Bacillus glycinifermentans]WKB77611.1 hypothetical protein QYM22_01475 [Bacillus glycinifermentans]
MNTDKQVFTATQKTAKTLKTYRDKSDEELLAFLAKQDSLTLNQLKVYYSDPSFALHYFISAAFFSIIAASFITAILSGQADSMFPFVSGISIITLAAIFVGCFFWVLKQLVTLKKKPSQFITHFSKKAEFARIVKMIDYVLQQKYKKALKNIPYQ